jgi:iron complex transport system ATP-binding protein
MLAVHDLAFGYGKQRIGEAVSFTVEAGSIVCVLGPNGSGKTTLFRTILGLNPPHAGQITLDNHDIAAWPLRERARAIAWVPQTHSTSFSFSVRELVLMGRTPHLSAFAVPTKVDNDKVLQALDRVGIVHLVDRVATELSGGERQLVLPARAIAQESRVMIMDEPTASLDLGNRVRVLHHVQRLAREGVATLVSTHEPDHALAIADKAILMEKGRLIQQGPPASVITGETLSRLYGVTVDVVEANGVRLTVPAIGRG